MSLIDAHCHIWKLSRGDYDWMDTSDPDLAPIAKDFTINDYLDAAKPLKPKKIVLVQAAATESETDFLLSNAKDNPIVGAVVGWVDLSKSDAVQKIIEFKQHPKFRGIRPMLQNIEDTSWLTSVPDQSIWKELVDLDISFDALIKPRHLQMITEFCIQNSELKIVIDHAAKPQWADPTFDLDSYLEKMAIIGQQSQAYCKISGLFTELSAQQYSDANRLFETVISHLLKHFGAKRLMWGSDWPVVNLAADYSTWHKTSQILLSNLDQTDQQAIFSETASRFYQISGDE